MTVRAKGNIKYDGSWRKPGEKFDVSLTDIDRIKDLVVVEDEPIRTDSIFSETSQFGQEDQKPVHSGRGRRKASN